MTVFEERVKGKHPLKSHCLALYLIITKKESGCTKLPTNFNDEVGCKNHGSDLLTSRRCKEGFTLFDVYVFAAIHFIYRQKITLSRISNVLQDS